MRSGYDGSMEELREENFHKVEDKKDGRKDGEKDGKKDGKKKSVLDEMKNVESKMVISEKHIQSNVRWAYTSNKI